MKIKLTYARCLFISFEENIAGYLDYDMHNLWKLTIF